MDICTNFRPSILCRKYKLKLYRKNIQIQYVKVK